MIWGFLLLGGNIREFLELPIKDPCVSRAALIILLEGRLSLGDLCGAVRGPAVPFARQPSG